MANALESLEQMVGGDVTDPNPVGPGLLNRVLDLYFLTLEQHEAEDTHAFESVIERIAYSCGPETRAELANRLSQRAEAPKRLMRRLAFENIVVSRPVLQYSNRLSDADLVTLVRKLGEEHQLAIAHRLKLNEIVTDELIEHGSTPVLITMVQNSGADISGKGRTALKKMSGSDAELSEAVSLRSDLNNDIPSRLRKFVLDRFFEEHDLDEELYAPVASAVDILSHEEAEGARPEAEPGPADGKDAPGSAGKAGARSGDHVMERDSMPPEFDATRFGTASEFALAEMARVGWVSGTVNCLARLTKTDETMARHCLMTADLSALMVLCKAHNFQNGTFTALLQLRDAKSDDENKMDIIGMLKRYEAMKPHTAKRIIQFADKKKEASVAGAG